MHCNFVVSCDVIYLWLLQVEHQETTTTLKEARSAYDKLEAEFKTLADLQPIREKLTTLEAEKSSISASAKEWRQEFDKQAQDLVDQTGKAIDKSITVVKKLLSKQHDTLISKRDGLAEQLDALSTLKSFLADNDATSSTGKAAQLVGELKQQQMGDAFDLLPTQLQQQVSIDVLTLSMALELVVGHIHLCDQSVIYEI